MRKFTLTQLSLIVLITACTHSVDKNAEKRGHLSTEMVNLSSAVDTYFADLPVKPTQNDATILQIATQHDPSLLAPDFQYYLLKIQYQNPYAVLLLCNKDSTRAIMEDAGCSARLDRQITDIAPCKFTLRVLRGCQVEGADPQ